MSIFSSILSEDQEALASALGVPASDSPYAGYLGYASAQNRAEVASAPFDSHVNYADPADFSGPSVGPAQGLMQMDPDPFGDRTARIAAASGSPLSHDGYAFEVDVFGRRMSRDRLLQSDAGRRLLELVERRRRGQKRGFLDAITDWSWEDLPFVSLLATVGKSVSDAVTVSDTFKKLQNGAPVTDDELIKTRLYVAENEERENGTWGATVGDIMRAAPGFMAEFFATGGVYSLARTGLTKLGKEGIHLGLTRATKTLAREAMQEAAERQVAKMGAKGAAGFAGLAADEAAKKSMVKTVAESVFESTMRANPMYKGLTDDALKAMARSRAEYEFEKMLARNGGGKIANGLNSFSQWMGQNASRGLMDFGAWGTEESTILMTGQTRATRALADAVGTFLVEAPLKGAMLRAPNQFIARPLVGQVLGKDGRAVSSAQLQLEESAYLTGNKELMAHAEAMSHGLSLLEYVSENTGRGLSSLLRAAGMGLEKAGVHGLVRPATRALGVAEDKMDAATLGGKMRQWVRSVFGSREEYSRRTVKDKAAAVARKLGVSGDADVRALETAVLSNSTSSLPPALASRIEGGDIGRFAMSAVKELTDRERRDFEYKTFGKFMVADWMARHQVGPDTVMNMFDRMGYDGVLGEMFEERYSDFAKGLLGWDDRADHDLWSNVKTAIKNLYPGWDQLTAEAVAFSMPMVMRAGILRAQSAVAGGDGTIRQIRAQLAGIADAFRVATVAPMEKGEYLASFQREDDRDTENIARLRAARDEKKAALDDAAKAAADAAVETPQARRAIQTAGDRAAVRAAREATERRMDDEERFYHVTEARRAAEERRRAVIHERAASAEARRLSKPGNAHEAVAQLDADLARAKKVQARRREMHEKFLASVPEAAEDTTELVVPLYTDDELADDARFGRIPLIDSAQAGEALAGRNAMVDYAPELSRHLVELKSPLEGEDVHWWRRAAHRLVGVAGALVTGDFSLAAMNPVRWTARDLGLSRNVVDGLEKNFRDYMKKAEDTLGANQGTVLEAVARLRGEAQRMREGSSANETGAAELERRAAALVEQYGEDGRIGPPTRKAVMDLAERLAAPAARRIMSANLAAHQLRSFTKTRVQDQALGLVARELGYEWYADRNDGGLRFYKYNGAGAIDEATATAADAFYAANRDRVDAVAKDITAAAVDILTRRLTKAGDESVRLLNAVTLPDPSELRQMAQARQPGQMGPVSQDAVMREAALYDAAMRAIGEGDMVERVRIDETSTIAETLDRGALGRVNMATVDYLAGVDAPEHADQRAFEALAWSLNLPFDGTEKGLAERNGKLFALAKLAAHFNRADKAFYSKATPIDDEEASRLTPNGNIPLSASLVDGAWHVDYGRDENGAPVGDVFATREEMDAKLAEMGYRPDKSRLVLTLARVVESSDMMSMLRELGLGYVYRDALSENLHPILRKNADGQYLPEDEARRVLAAELAAAEGGEHAPKSSPEFVAWAKVWGEKGYMRVGERLLKANGVEKSVVAKYAGEFTDYAPTVYTLKLSAGRIAPTSANVYVPVDPLVNPDIVSGVVNGILIHGFMSHPRLLRNSLGGVVSEFARQVNAVIDAHAAETDDKQLRADLERFRRIAVEDVDKAADRGDGGMVVWRGAGMTASGFALLANAFVMGRESDYQASPHLRACAEIASDVRMCPAFPDFCNVVDLVLGGSGFLSAAAREAAKAEERPEDQRGLQRVMTYAASDPKAMGERLREMRPLGLEPRMFLDLCVRRLAAVAKSGAPAVPSKEMDELRSEAEAASGDNPAPKAHLTFYGHLIAVVKRMLDTDLPVDEAVRDFIKDIAETAQDEPGVTQAQRKGLRQMLGILTRTHVTGRERRTYIDAFNTAKTAEQRYNDAVKARRQRGRELRNAKRANERAAERGEQPPVGPNVYEDLRRAVTETRAIERKLKEEYSRSLKEVKDAKNQVQADMGAGEAAEILGYDAKWTRLPTEGEKKDIDKGVVKGATEANMSALTGDKEVEEDDSRDAVDEDQPSPTFSTGGTDAVELPEAAALGEDKTVMSHGFTEVPVEMDRSVQKLAVNVCVRAVAMSARAKSDPNADPLAPAVTEDSVVARAKTLFHLSDREADALRFQYRVADDLRMQANRPWDDFAVSGAVWEFQEDDKADDDVSSDNFTNRALAEYNSPFLKDALALAARVAPESGTNLRAFVARTKEWLRTAEERGRSTPAMKFAASILDPRLDPRGKTQAEQSALHMKALAEFDDSPDAVAAHVQALLAPDGGGGFPTSRRLGFLLSYMASLRTEDRRNFALLCANSVSAQAVHVKKDFREGDFVEERRVGAGDKVSDRIVGDTFVHVLEGRPASEAARLAADLRAAQAETLRSYPRGGAKVVAAVLSRVFGRETPLVTALASDAAARHRARKGDKKVNAELAKSVTPVDGRIPVVESIAATLESLAARGEALTADSVTAAFVALFETGRPDQDVGVRRLASGPSFSDPLKAWLSTYADSLPATILSAEVDQRRETTGSSVPIAPRDSVPMVSRWIYSDEGAKGVVDGRVVEFPTFMELARRAFPGATDAEIERCRQDACWPDGTPVCAKNTSSSLTTRELYLACERAYKKGPKSGDAWYIPLYAGDHSSSTMLRIPWSVKMDGFMKAAQASSESQVPAAPADVSPMNVWYSTGENAEFSNLAERPFEYEGHRYVSVEHAYQTLKSGVFDEETYRKPWAAGKKFRGKTADTSKNVQLMRALVLESFRQNPDAAAKLAATGSREFTHAQDKGVWAKEFPAALEAARAALQDTTSRIDLVRVSFPGNNPHKAKDEAKFNQFGGITKFIGFGPGSTGLYAKTLARIANTGSYSPTDIVGVSVNGRRKDRVPVRGTDVEKEVRAAAASGALIITDSSLDRNRDYNIGERELADLLKELGYEEASGTGFWTRRDLRGEPAAWAIAHPPDAAPGVVTAADTLNYRAAAKAMSYAVGMNLMYTDTKRSAITSLENQGAGLIGAEVQGDGTVKYGEHRVHIIHNWAFEREGYSFKSKNEALLGTTRMYGYGARTMKTLSRDRGSDLLKLHLISTSGHDLFFIKSLSVAVPDSKEEGFLEGTMNGVIDAYARKFRGNDHISTDTYTDDDSYKIGVGNSKAILVKTPDGKTQKLKDWLFSRLRDACEAPKDASEEDVAKAFKSAYGKLTGDALDELVGDVPIADLARTDGSESVPMKLSELMPGVMVNAVEGLDGPCLDLSYREDGAMAYTVANVSHSSRVSNEPGRTPRNYEMDMIAAAVMLGVPDKDDKAYVDRSVVQAAFDLVSNWGLVAACVYATKPQRDAAAARSSAVENLRLNGEHPDGQNIRSEVARAVWAQVRENANIPVKGVDAALVACGASIDEDNRLMAHTKSAMHRAMMRGAEIFTPEEQEFFGKRFRHALCNVNMTAPGFRHAWFLDHSKFDAGKTDREIAKEIEALFVKARELARRARDADADGRKAAEAAALAAKKDIARLFVDHHGVPIWSDDPSKPGYSETYVGQFSLDDLFDAGGKFDMSALQLDGDRVRLDADPPDAAPRILLGGTRFGFPRTPSYNAHYETVRAGLPVTERKYVDADGRTRWRVGRDAMVSPDPYTNKTLGTDHDGDKSKLYLLHTDKYGLAEELTPPAPSSNPDSNVLDGLADNALVDLPDGTRMRARDAYTKALYDGKWLEKVWVNPETGQEEPVPKGESPEGAYLRVSDRAKLRVSNAFVRTMFTISDSVPTLDMDGKERVSKSSSDRVKCLGGIAFRPVSTQPVLTDKAWRDITANATAPVLGEREETRPDGTKVKVKETVGDPWKAAEVSTSAEDADGARGTVVSLARTLHVAFASGQFSDLFGGQPTGMQWLAFIDHFDGLSNATFDDIKEQICGRLGWTKGMMDTVVVELLSSMDHLPTTDEDWSEILGAYAANVKAGRAEYWMLKASSVEEDEFVKNCLKILGVKDEVASKENLHAAMGVAYDDYEKRWKPVQGKAPAIVVDLYNHASAAGFNYVVESVSRGLGHNSTLGRLAYIAQSGGGADLVKKAARWADKRAQLDKAQKFERAVNYLTADPGDASKFARYGTDEEKASVVADPATGTLVGGITKAAFRKMETATGMMYRAAGNLATVEASAVLAAYRRDENLAKLAETSRDAAAFLFVKDAMPRWDRMGLTANRQQLPQLLSFFLRQASIAERVEGTPLDTGAKLYGAVKAMAAKVAKWRGDSPNRGLAARVAIESLFSVMYRLMSTSEEFADGHTLPAYLRAPADGNFDEEDYGALGGMLKRIMPGYRSNDREAHERVRAMYDAILRGEAFASPRRGQGFKAVCRGFSLARDRGKTRGSLSRYIAEQLPQDVRGDFLAGKMDFGAAMRLIPEDLRTEVENAALALSGLEEYLGVEKGSVSATPAMVFGQLLPLYSLMTSRCLGAPDPSSPSILALAPAWVYEEISAGEAELSARMPELVDSVVAANWAPYLENVRKTGKKRRFTGGKRTEVDVKVKDVDALAAGLPITMSDEGEPVLPKRPDAEDAAEHRENPDWRTTVDIFSDGAFAAALAAAGPSTAKAVPAEPPAPGPAPKGRGAYDERTARVAGALGLAFGSWATVEYNGGRTFTIRGRLRGTVGRGQRVVFTVDMDGKLCESEQQIEALADSEAYGASLAECVDLGIESGQDFLRLPRSTRLALVGRYGVGGATLHHVNWKFDGRGVATLAGAIRLGSSKADTTVFHEYFHGMMRVFDAVGLFSEEDKAALRKTFGKPARKGQWFNEERAADAFRKWVEGKMDPKAAESRGIFRRIYDALKGVLLAIRRGFGYTDDSKQNMELLFGFVAHGVAQASESRVAELSAGLRAKAVAARSEAADAFDENFLPGEDSSWMQSLSAEREASALEARAAALDAAYLARNDVAVATAVAQIVPPPRIENVKLPVDELSRRTAAVARTREGELAPVKMPDDAPYQLEAAKEFSQIGVGLRNASAAKTAEVEALLQDPAAPAAELKAAMSELLDVRRRTAGAMGVELAPERETPGTADEDLDFAPGSAEAAVEETRRAVKSVPMAEVNDFYRAANFIHESLERALASEGSWQEPLAETTRRYTRPEGPDVERDKAAVMHGLRRALEAVNPAAAARLGDDTVSKSLAFEAALRMYHGFDAWAAARSKAPGGTPLPPEPGSDEASAEASQYNVSAWILASCPLDAPAVVRRALDRTEEFLGDAPDGPVKAELLRHREALRSVLATVGDAAGLMDLRRGGLKPVFDKAFASLKEGTKLNGHTADGRLRDITPNIDQLPEYRAKGMTRALDRMASFQNTYESPAVQESLKSALEALWQAQAQAKFYRETDVAPSTAEDMEFAQQMTRRHNAPHMTPAEWAATQAIGDSNLSDNRPLVDFYCQSAFIADNVDAWLQSLVRKSFGSRGDIGAMLSAENREYGALKMRVADLENFYSLLLGTNVEDGGRLLKVETVHGKWRQRWGEIVRDESGTYLKIDNYRRKYTDVRLTEEDLRAIDLFLKAISARVGGQDRVITGYDRLWFSPADLDADYSREAIDAKWNGGHPTAHMTRMELLLARLDHEGQLPEKTVREIRFHLARAARGALDAIRARAAETGEEIDEKTLNRRVLRALRDSGYAEVRGDWSTAVIAVPVASLIVDFNRIAKPKLLRAGRRAEWIDPDKIAADFMEVYRDAVRFARKHPWLLHGDGQHFHNFGTTLPFWRGGGVFMYHAARSERVRSGKELAAMPAVEKAMHAACSAKDVDVPMSRLEYKAYAEILERVGEAYQVPEPGVRFAEAVRRGDYAEGSDLAARTGLVLPGDATKADLARALYKKALEDMHSMATGAKDDDYRSAEAVIREFEDSALERGELFGDTFGLNDQDVYRIHGKLPANAQIGHKVHLAIDGLTNAMMSRATLANLLMTPAADGAPMYYADPSAHAADVSGLPDGFWANVARWWAEWNGLEYDAKLTGVQNAKAIYEKVHESRKRNKGRIGEKDRARSYSELSGDDAKDCLTVERWLVRDDDRTFEESSVVNAVAGGEAMGYLKQFVQAGRTLGFGGNMTRATLHRALSWSKSMSVAFSLFFPLATKWESPIGAVGATATIMSNLRGVGDFLRKHPELADMMQKAVGGRGWVTQNFLGFNDIIEMMDTNDPFLAEMKAWANALGVTLSSSLVNPMEETKSLMTEDLHWLQERVRDKMGSKAAAKFGRIVETVVTRGGDKAFNYALNATKLAVVAQMCMKLRHQAQARGKAFDPVRDLRRYGRYINAEVGGIDPLQYAWATPLNRGIMNTLMFSWQWTRGAWEAGGGAIVEDLLLGGHTMTKEEREYIVGRWCRMFGAVMIGVPALMQCVVMGLAKALGGGDDDDDRWFTWQNEDKTRWTAFDLTPLLRAIERADSTPGANRAGALLGGIAGLMGGGRIGGIGGALASAALGAAGGAALPEGTLRGIKQKGGAAGAALGAVAGAALGRMNGGNAFTSLLGGVLGAAGGAAVPSLVPMYTGEDTANRTNRARRYYMHFGKQGWEFFRWFEDAKGQFFSKLSMPTQRILEGVMGRNLSYLDRALPWDEMGQFERWLNPTADGAAWNLAQAFLPFSLGGVQRTGDAGFLPIVGPVQMGASQTNIQDRLVKAITAWARNDREGYRWGGPSKAKSSHLLQFRVADILQDAKANGFDPEQQLNKAYGQVATKLYGELIDLIPDDPEASYDVKAVERVARAINRVGAKKAQVLRSLRTRIEARLKAKGLTWKDMPGQDRVRIAQAAAAPLDNPFRTIDY